MESELVEANTIALILGPKSGMFRVLLTITSYYSFARFWAAFNVRRLPATPSLRSVFKFTVQPLPIGSAPWISQLRSLSTLAYLRSSPSRNDISTDHTHFESLLNGPPFHLQYFARMSNLQLFLLLRRVFPHSAFFIALQWGSYGILLHNCQRKNQASISRRSRSEFIHACSLLTTISCKSFALNSNSYRCYSNLQWMLI